MNAAAPGSTTASTAVRIVSISAAQNKRGKDCYEGGMGAGHFTWYKDMGGNSNWMYLAVTNATDHHVSLALWLLYDCLLYTSPSPRDGLLSRMPSSA